MLKFSALKEYPATLIIPVVWFGTTFFTIVMLTLLLFFTSSNTNRTPQKYSLYSSRPLVLGAMTGQAGTGDTRAAKIDGVFSSYDCPLTGLGQKFVDEADKNNIPFWLVAAVSFQESSCGKKVPGIGKEMAPSYNAWGWAVYGDKVQGFKSWEHGIEVVSEYMNERFFSRGTTELCEIMKTYTPPSKGSWCAGVGFFQNAIEQYRSPQN